MDIYAFIRYLNNNSVRACELCFCDQIIESFGHCFCL
jgi:hypothetical protein